MRILSVGNRYPPWSLGGYETVWQRANGFLSDRGHEVVVLTTGPDPSDLPGRPEPGVHRDLRWYWREHAFPAVDLRACLALERRNAEAFDGWVTRLRPDAVLWWAMGGMSLSLLARPPMAGIPAVGLVGDEWMIYGPTVDGWIRRFRGRRRALAPFVERLTGVPARVDLDNAARWLFNSEHLLALTRHSSGRSLPTARVVHPGVDPGRFPPAPGGPWGWRLLCCGRIDPRKGVDAAVRALPSLPGEATLVVHGSGERAYLAELRALADRLGVGARVRFSQSGPAEVAGVYAAADALVFPVTWEEPWGLVPLEAMAVGRPVLASRAGGGPAEYLTDGVNCLQFAPGDADGLAALVRRVAESSELRASLVASGHATAERFTETAFHAGLEDELLSAVSR